ncbi:MAG: FtsX-like permease family protein, partial [Muribaculaceae bacterium]|nr:FtsX-like permease family protein [Muribaculaceae bacterium]
YNMRQIKIYEPNRMARINPANPMGAFRSDSVLMAGVFQVERQEYDNDMMFVPLSVLRSLLNYDDEASMIEIRVEPGMSIDKAKEEIASMLPSELRVLDRLEQQQESLRMIAIEKWVTLAMLIFIMIIASFNILSTMSMLIVEKQPNHAILESMGATREMISKIYSSLSFIISVIGGLIGLLLGTAASLAQQFGGFIKFNAADMSAMAIDTYPVKVVVSDVAFVAVVIVVLGFITSRIMRLR